MRCKRWRGRKRRASDRAGRRRETARRAPARSSRSLVRSPSRSSASQPGCTSSRLRSSSRCRRATQTSLQRNSGTRAAPRSAASPPGLSLWSPSNLIAYYRRPWCFDEVTTSVSRQKTAVARDEMGKELNCSVRFGKQQSAGKALLETSEILFRGEFQLKIPFSTIKSAKAVDGELRLQTAGGLAVFHLGGAAEKWCEKI